jgi:putative transposase
MRYSSSEKDEAVSNTGLNRIQVKHRPKLLSDNSPYYLSGKTVQTHIREARYHPMTQGKIEHYH